MVRKKALILVFLMTVNIFMASGCSSSVQAEEQTVWRLAHEEVAGGIQDLYCYEFKKLVEERTNGEITVEIFRDGEIGSVNDYFEFVQGGLLNFAILNPGTTSTTIPENNIFYNHFLLPEDEDDIKELLRTSEAIKKLNEINEEHELLVLDWFFEGHNAWTANKAIRSPEDFKGVSIRTMGSPLIVASYQAYNANPTPMPYMEVYSGLQLNQIDAQVNPVFAIQEMAFYEVQDYLILGKQDGFYASFVANPDFFNELDNATQEMIKEITLELNDYIFEVQSELNVERLEMIKEASDIEVIELTAEEREVFRESTGKARNLFLRSVGEEGKEIFKLMEEESLNIMEGKNE